jgi:competence ComEA-like helix-hairpin-helix protein
MLSPERRAVLLLLALAVAGQGVRYLVTRPGEPPGQVQLLSVLPPGSPGAQKDSAMRRSRPLAAGERVDADVASAAELARLPRVGLGLAKNIVAHRDTHGPFGNLAGLDRVPGIGPGLLRAMEPRLSFSGTSQSPAPHPTSGAAIGTAFAPPPLRELAAVSAAPSSASLNVNRATAVELEGLPGIGPALARRIVADREARGPFATIEALDRVPGIGPALMARLGTWVTAP